MKKYLAGAVIGDVVGSRFEQNNYRKTDFELLITSVSVKFKKYYFPPFILCNTQKQTIDL